MLVGSLCVKQSDAYMLIIEQWLLESLLILLNEFDPGNTRPIYRHLGFTLSLVMPEPCSVKYYKFLKIKICCRGFGVLGFWAFDVREDYDEAM